ncbi:zinc finger and BTB domain-containing protein 17-like [Wyeomyia smithii]|uniref:zinc finger and BTB domain-containing protein 17-like n=1 Tax=Wyeomyia smithii TaxID=174621 RepID=UPI0024681A9A|nr:zinc finger and BTB domain-containing protein 17-like [Wyeomyia smithii]
MEVCRTCGELPADQHQLGQSLQNFSDIYFNLTSIKILPEENPDRLKICDDCHTKLLEYNRFRTICLQVHYKLSVVKEEKESDQLNTETCEPIIETLKVESVELSEAVSLPADDFEDDVIETVEEEQDPQFSSPSENDGSNSEHSDAVKSTKRKKKIKTKKSTKNPARNKEPLIECKLCDKKFRSETRFQGHMRTHQGLKPALCTYCNKDFQKYISLKFHIRQKHSDEQIKFPCDFPGCELVYSSKQSMTKHRKRHDPNFVMPEPKHSVCDQCGKTFSTTGALKKHSYIHTGDMPFECSLCKKRLPTAHKLKEHTMRHEGIKNHVCPYCGQKKTTRHELKVHMNYHTREKQFTCHVCAQVFSNIGNMSRHIKIVHCGIKAYPCTYCDRSFGKAETLKHHVMTHTGEKPHECKVCGKRFIQQVALQTHMKTHRKHGQIVPSSVPVAGQSEVSPATQQQLQQQLQQQQVPMIVSHDQQSSQHSSTDTGSPVCMGGFVH